MDAPGYPQPGKPRPIRDTYPTILAELDCSKVNQLALEFEGPGLDPRHLAACKSKTVLFGCVFNSDDTSETAEHVARRLLAAAEVLGPERIQAAPDCGLVMMSPQRAAEKLCVMVRRGSARACEDYIGKEWGDRSKRGGPANRPTPSPWQPHR